MSKTRELNKASHNNQFGSVQESNSDFGEELISMSHDLKGLKSASSSVSIRSPSSMSSSSTCPYERENRLIRALKDRDWNCAMKRCKICPGEASEWGNFHFGGEEISITSSASSSQAHINPPTSVVNLLPLHYACSLRNPSAPPGLIRELIRCDIDATSISDKNGKFPLHWAVDTGTCGSVAIVDMLLKAWPDAASKREDVYGFLPLHMACFGGDGGAGGMGKRGDRLQEIDPDDHGPYDLDDFNPNNCGESDDDANDQVSIVKSLLECYPRGTSCRDFKGWLPLHIAARTLAPAGIVRSLVTSNPSAARDSDEDYRLPIHLACMGDAVVHNHQQKNHQTEMEEVRDGVPLDDEINSIDENTLTVVNILACAFPEGLSMRERSYGFLPIHIACSSSSPSISSSTTTMGSSSKSLSSYSHNKKSSARARLIDLLLSISPESTNTSDRSKNRSKPIHVATRSNAPHDVIRTLLQYDKRSSRYVDSDGRTPLHWSCHVGASRKVIDTLLDSYPKASCIRESKYGFTPLHVTCHRCCFSHGSDIGNRKKSIDSIIWSLLSSSSNGAACRGDFDGSLPLHLACRNINHISANAIKMLLDVDPNTIHTKDRMGRTPLELAESAMKKKKKEPREDFLFAFDDEDDALKMLKRYEKSLVKADKDAAMIPSGTESRQNTLQERENGDACNPSSRSKSQRMGSKYSSARTSRSLPPLLQVLDHSSSSSGSSVSSSSSTSTTMSSPLMLQTSSESVATESKMISLSKKGKYGKSNSGLLSNFEGDPVDSMFKKLRIHKSTRKKSNSRTFGYC